MKHFMGTSVGIDVGLSVRMSVGLGVVRGVEIPPWPDLTIKTKTTTKAKNTTKDTAINTRKKSTWVPPIWIGYGYYVSGIGDTNEKEDLTRLGVTSNKYSTA